MNNAINPDLYNHDAVHRAGGIPSGPNTRFAEPRPKPIHVPQAISFGFAGLARHMDEARERHGFTDLQVFGKAKGIEPVKQITQALGSISHEGLSEFTRVSIEDKMARAVKWRDTLVIMLEACDAGIAETSAALGLTNPITAREQPADVPANVRSTSDPVERIGVRRPHGGRPSQRS